MVVELELSGITRQFPGVLANDHIDLSVERGEIRCLLGENGAGKSTLMGVLFGLIRPDAGTIRIRGSEVHFSSARDAILAGLGMVHQAFRLFPSLTVTDNVVYGSEPQRLGLIDSARAEEEVTALAGRYGFAIAPRARVGDLPVGVQQRVEILKALYRHASILILDEPTAVLTPQEASSLFEVLRGLAADGRTIIFITHKLEEVMAVSDGVTVLRDGRVVGNWRTSETSPEEIGRAMTGRNLAGQRARVVVEPGEPLLVVKDLHVGGAHGREAVRGVSLEVRAGEIVGIAGVSGNGQTELVEAIVGIRECLAGEITIGPTDASSLGVAARRRSGLAYVPEDRRVVGTAELASVADNLAAGSHRAPPIARRGVMNPTVMRSHADRLVDRYQIKVPSIDALASTLSGGNLQKLVIAREFEHQAEVVIAEQPTRGIDIGATEYIHRQLLDVREARRGVLLVSSELSEILALSDRVLVMYEGRIVGELDGSAATEEELGLLMAGHRPLGDGTE